MQDDRRPEDRFLIARPELLLPAFRQRTEATRGELDAAFTIAYQEPYDAMIRLILDGALRPATEGAARAEITALSIIQDAIAQSDSVSEVVVKLASLMRSPKGTSARQAEEFATVACHIRRLAPDFVPPSSEAVAVAELILSGAGYLGQGFAEEIISRAVAQAPEAKAEAAPTIIPTAAPIAAKDAGQAVAAIANELDALEAQLGGSQPALITKRVEKIPTGTEALLAALRGLPRRQGWAAEFLCRLAAREAARISTAPEDRKFIMLEAGRIMLSAPPDDPARAAAQAAVEALAKEVIGASGSIEALMGGLLQ